MNSHNVAKNESANPSERLRKYLDQKPAVKEHKEYSRILADKASVDKLQKFNSDQLSFLFSQLGRTIHLNCLDSKDSAASPAQAFLNALIQFVDNASAPVSSKPTKVPRNEPEWARWIKSQTNAIGGRAYNYEIYTFIVILNQAKPRHLFLNQVRGMSCL